MDNLHLMKSLPLLAGLAARSFGCTVVQDANTATASVNKDRVIRIAPLKDFGDPGEAELVVGKVVHEVVHIAYTNFDVGQGESEFVHHLANILEDVWGERRQAREYPGAQGKICAALKVMMDRGLFGAPSDQETPQSLIAGMLVRGLRSQHLGQSLLQPGYETFRAATEAAIGEDPTRKIWEIAQAVRACESTEAAYAIARKIAEQLKEDAETPQPSQSQPQQGDGDGKGEPAPASGDAADPSPGQDGAASGQGQNGQPDPQSGSHPGSGAPSAAQAAAIEEALNATDAFGHTDFGDALDEEMEKAGICNPGGRNAGDVLDPNPGVLPEQPDLAQAIRVRATPIAAQLGRRLESLLEDRRESSTYRRSAGRKLDRMALSGIPSGNMRVFRHREEEDGIDTALSILIDISASMKTRLSDGIPGIQAVENATWALGDVLEKHDIPFAVTAFGQRTSCLKGFGESWRKAGRRVWQKLEPSTVTHFAVRKASSDLLQQEAQRKLLLLITDGAPSSINETAVAIREAQRAGCEVAILFVADKTPIEFDLALRQAGTGIRSTRIRSGEGIARHVFSAVQGAF